MREVVFDTETTGLDPKSGHRLVEVGCIELMNHIPTGESFHRYINPERDMPDEAFRVHGLSADFLAKHETFDAHAQALVEFIGDSPLVIHNADFDMNFLNHELTAIGLPIVPRSQAIDTLYIARRKFPGAPASLDALCKRFNVDLSGRNLHGALLDAQLLASVYIELIGGRQAGLELAAATAATGKQIAAAASGPIRREPRPDTVSAEELAKHEEFLKKIKGALWSAAE
ncbi:MAG TPA: DNA polymerase III subunit epsilon [Magnetospirillaceae bacterium]|jgi:DNA polymerase-3 subunit epsilon